MPQPSARVIAAQTVAIYLLASLGILSAVVRVAVLARPDLLPVADSIVDTRYAEHPAWTVLHVVSGSVFFLIGPLQFIPALRRRAPALHRAMGRVYIVAGLLAGVSTWPLILALPVLGGVLMGVVSAVASAWMCLCLVRAYLAARARRIAAHRAWMIRGFAMGLGIATIRVLNIALEAGLGLSWVDWFGWSGLVAFSLHAVVAEAILRRGVRAPARQAA